MSNRHTTRRRYWRTVRKVARLAIAAATVAAIPAIYAAAISAGAWPFGAWLLAITPATLAAGQAAQSAAERTTNRRRTR